MGPVIVLSASLRSLAVKPGARVAWAPTQCGLGFRLYVHHGAGAYICGEETALLECLEGKKGQPRLKPPFPANIVLYGRSHHRQQCRKHRGGALTIIRRGGDWFAGIGRPNNTGTKLFCISGHVNKPCNVEEEMGIPLRELIENALPAVCAAAGTTCWRSSRAALRCRCCRKATCDDILMDFDSLKAVQTGPGHRRRDRDGQVHRRDQGDPAAGLFLQA